MTVLKHRQRADTFEAEIQTRQMRVFALFLIGLVLAAALLVIMYRVQVPVLLPVEINLIDEQTIAVHLADPYQPAVPVKEAVLYLNDVQEPLQVEVIEVKTEPDGVLIIRLPSQISGERIPNYGSIQLGTEPLIRRVIRLR